MLLPVCYREPFTVRTLGLMAVSSGSQAPGVCLHPDPGLSPIPERVGSWRNGHARDAGLGIDRAVQILLLPAGT